MRTDVDKFIEKAKAADAEVELFPNEQTAVQFLKDFFTRNETANHVIPEESVSLFF